MTGTEQNNPNNQNNEYPTQRSGIIAYLIGRLLLAVMGWKIIGQVPPYKKFVLIAAPHTSNWDFPLGLAALYSYRLKVSWAGKDTLFKAPYGCFMRWLGGISIDRSSPHNVVSQLADKFKQSEEMVLVITPSGTRKKMPHWKSGFYWIAREANVPIACGYLDYKTKTLCLDLCFMPTGNVKQDMDRIREFYADVHAKYPENKTDVRLKDEG